MTLRKLFRHETILALLVILALVVLDRSWTGSSPLITCSTKAG